MAATPGRHPPIDAAGALRGVPNDLEQAPHLAVLAQEGVDARPEWPEVMDLAELLLGELAMPSTRSLILTANQPGESSSGIQGALTPFLVDHGFRSEAKGLFADYHTRSLRPDFYRATGDTGILLEVERGKTVDNNMDLLDFWKAHICLDADYLFLLVPTEYRSNATRPARNLFRAVHGRLSSFFQRGNYTNVAGLFLFGY